MADVNILDFQLDILKDPVKNIAMIGGYGSSKSHILAMFITEEMLKFPGKYFCAANNSYPQLMGSTWESIQKYWLEIGIKWSGPDKVNVVHIGNGSKLKLQSLSVPLGELKGSEYSAIIFDEADVTTEEYFQYLSARARQPGGSHKIRLAGNAVPPGHWIARIFKLQPLPEHKLYQLSSYQNKFLPSGYFKRLEAMYPPGTLGHRRWVLGDLVALEGAIYPEFNENKHLVDSLPPFCDHFCAIDWGTNDPTVILSFGLTNCNKIYLYDEYYQSGLAFSQHKSEILRRCGGRATFIDHSARDMAELKLLPVSPQFAHKEVNYGIELVRKRLINGGFRILRGKCPKTIEAFYNYVWRKSNVGEEKPEHKFSHTMDCVRYGVCAVDHQNLTVSQAQDISGVFTF